MLVSVVSVSFAQDFDDEEECESVGNSKAEKLYKKALSTKNSAEKTQLLKDALHLEPDYLDANYKMARLAMGRESYKAAKAYLLKVLDICPTYNIYVHYYLGRIYYGSDDYSNTVKHMKKFIKDPDKIKADRHYDLADKMIKDAEFYGALYDHPVPFEPVNVPGICTQKDEYLPYITADNEIAYFTRKFSKKAMGDLFPKMVEEFTFSKRVDGVFRSGGPMPSPFNKGDNEGGASLTIDNMHMYFTVCKMLSNGYNNCDIYTADYVYIDEESLLDVGFMSQALDMTEAEMRFELQELKKSGAAYMWTNVKPLSENINSIESWESQPSISSNGNTLYFTSNRKGGKGGLDIYKTIRDSSGGWSSPVNLGDVINTVGNEKSPFIHPDRETFYFCSDGHRGLGGFDIFIAKLKKHAEVSDSTVWIGPKNIGYPINTEKDDLGFFVSTDGKTGFFSSNNNSDKFRSRGGWDLYSFPLHEGARPEKVLFLKGELKGPDGEALTDAAMQITNVRTKVVTKVNVDSTSGKYAAVVTLEEDDNFIMMVEKENYAFTAKFITSDEAKQEVSDLKPVSHMDVELKPVALGEPYKLDHINFSSNSSSVLTMESMMILDGFVGYLKKNPDMQVAIHGHTDNIGSDTDNIELSKNRARSVKAYLSLSGIDAFRLSHKGYGESKPISSNSTERGKAENRRTEFVITSF